ncbi:methylmalonic aciduria type A protein, mitochondrial-like [Hyalella azteca]|nr:methylmalonic aciduria type A protein, mitochondrial-like [Hyalella azteca]
MDLLLKDAAENLTCLGPDSLSMRIGLSGPPGAGKSTFIEKFGKHLTGCGHRVAVLAVDPSSATTGGSILGDKTRMPELTVDPSAYIRPSPARGHLGGVTRSTNEAIVLCEAAGYDVVIVETVGVGQSEISVADMVDLFGLIIAPAGGDELQGLKKGIVEMCDMVIVNKSDGDLLPAAMRTQADYLSSLKYARPRWRDWRVPVLRVSSVTCEGLEKLWATMTSYRKLMLTSGQLLQRRREQQRTWLHSHLQEAVMTEFMNTGGMAAVLADMEKKVSAGIVTPGNACDELVLKYKQLLK